MVVGADEQFSKVWETEDKGVETLVGKASSAVDVQGAQVGEAPYGTGKVDVQRRGA